MLTFSETFLGYLQQMGKGLISKVHTVTMRVQIGTPN